MVRRDVAQRHVQRLLEYVPRSWSDVALGHAPQQPHGHHHVSDATVQSLLNRLGCWAQEPGRLMPSPVHLSALSVRVACMMLIQPNIDMRLSRWKEFIAEAYGVQAHQVHDAQLALLRTVLARVSRRVKWRNRLKVVTW